ncbi:MAG: type II toxin-antitoxin system RelE/ParE family toxin [Gammaproteobacteria bacterium]|nr:type II toxin-antitoxin system RelE/ParE family toxin [Gammaproteobacteria bacterium]
MATYKVSVRANQDLLDIGLFTEQNWGRAQRNKYLDEIDLQFQKLADNPHLGISYNEIRASYRGQLVGKHIIFYIPYNYGVRIVRVLHQNMDYKKHF